MKRTVAGVRRAKGRPVLLLALVAIAAALLLSACGSRQGIGASQSWSGVAIQESAGSAFVGTRDGRIIQLVLQATGNGAVQASQGAIFDAKERPEGKETRSRVGSAFYGTPTVANGHVYAASYQGFVYSMLAAGADGAPLSNVNAYEIQGDNLAKGIEGDVIYSNGLLVAAASENINQGRLYILNADKLDAGATATDVEHCRYPAGQDKGVGRVWTTPLVVDGIAYFGDLDHQVHAVNIDTCQPVWSAPAELGGGIVATPIAINGKLYVGAFDRKMYAIDMSTGGTEELFEADSWFWATPVADGNMLYAPNLDGVLYAYDAASKSLAWQYDQEGDRSTILAAPTLVNGNIVMASDSGTVTVVNEGGSRVANYAIPGDEIRAPVTSSGTSVYVHTLDEKIVSFSAGSNNISKDWEFQLQGF